MGVTFYIKTTEEEGPPAEAIEHTTYLFSYEDGYLERHEDIEVLAWYSSAPVTDERIWIDALGVGDSDEDRAPGPDASDFYIIPDVSAPYQGTNRYRVKVTSREECWQSGGSSPLHKSTAYGQLVTYADAFYDQISYEDRNGFPWNSYWFSEWNVSWPDTIAYDETITRYFDGENWNNFDGKGMQFTLRVSTDGPGRWSFLGFTLIGLWNQEEYNAGGDGWDGAHDDTTADNVYTPTRSQVAMSSNYYGGSTMQIMRSFLKFDTTPVSSGNRWFDSAYIELYPYNYADADVIVVQGTQSDGDPVANDYDNFTAIPVISGAIDWQLGSKISTRLNAIGEAEVEAGLSSPTEIKYCLRQYDNDYLDVEPEAGYFRCGMYFHGYTPGVATNFSPCLKITYTKVPVWVDRTDTSYWTPTFGSWNGSGWDSGIIDYIWIAVNGTWAQGERWAGVRFTYTGGTLDNAQATDQTTQIFTNETILSGEVFTIPWLRPENESNGNLQTLILQADAAWTLTKIEFLER